MSSKSEAWRKKQPRIWLKYALTYFLLLAVPFVAFSLYFSSYLSSETEKNTQEKMTQSLSRIQSSFEEKISQMAAIGMQICKNSNFRFHAFEPFNYAARKDIRDALISYTDTSQFFSDIVYYNREYPSLAFTTTGTYNAAYYRVFSDQESGEWRRLDELPDSWFQRGWVPPEAMSSGPVAFSRALLYCLPLEEIQNGYLFFEIRESSVQRLLSASAGDEIYILDGDVTLYPFYTKPNLAEIAQMEKTPLKKTDGRYKCAVSVTRSGLTYVYISEMNEINAAAQTVLNTFMALTVLLGLVCFGAAVMASQRHARPIEQLVRQSEGIAPDDVRGVARIQSAMNQLQFRSQELDIMRQDSMRGNALIRLVRGKYRGKGEAEDNLRRLGMTFRQPYRAVMLLRQDQEWDERDAGRAVTDILSRRHDAYSFAYAERSAFVILLGMDTDDREQLAQELIALAALPEFAGKKLHFSVGGCFTDLVNAQQSFMQALSSSRRSPASAVTLFQESDAEELFYPRDELEALGAALSNQDRNRTIFLYDVLLTLIEKHNHIYLYTVSLLSEMIDLYLQSLSWDNAGAAEGNDGYAAILKSEYINDVDDMLTFLRQLHARAIQRMTENDLSSSATEMTGIANYISACEELDTITVGSVADRFGMNVSSLSHKFKEQMGCNISDYILSCKMNHACALLRSTDETIADIAQKVGYSQYTSFVRTFKREKGQTPTAYRDAWRQGKEN